MIATQATDPTAPASADVLEALPVLLGLGRPDAARLVAWVEGVLGWQPVDAGTGGLPPRLRIVDVPGAAAGALDGGDVPVVLLVSPEDVALEVAAAVQRARPAAVVAWPEDRERIATVAAELVGRARPRPTGELTLRIGGTAGGVGTTTVALAVGALAAWRQGATLVVTSGTVPVVTPSSIALEALTAERTFDEAATVPGVPGLRVVHAEAPPGDAAIEPGRAAVVIRDAAVSDDVDVLVLRRDAAGVAGLERSAAALAVVLDDGLAPLRAVIAAGGGRPAIVVPRSARVARAALLRRVPTALPASYLRALLPVIAPEATRGR